MPSSFDKSQPSPLLPAGWIRLLLLLVSLVPAAMLVPWIVSTWVNIPFFDDWGTPGHQLVLLCEGKLTLMNLFSQHNESRPFFPRLIFIALARFGGWDVRRVLCASFAMVGVASFLVRGLVRRLPGVGQPGVLMLSLAVNLVLFWPYSEIWNFSNTFIMVFSPVMLLCALHVNLSGMSLRNKALWNALFATVATYSWSNGMLLWVLAAPVSGAALAMQGAPWQRGRKQAKWYLFYAAACAVNLLWYFQDFHRPPDSPPVSWNPVKLAGYFFTWLGGFSGEQASAPIAGICVFILFLPLACICVRSAWKKRDFTDCYPWLALALYALVSGAVASLGRSGFGNYQAMSPRYTAVAGYFYIATAGLWYLAWRALGERFSLRLPRLAASVALVLCIPFVFRSYGRGVHILKISGDHRKALLVAWQWSKAIPDNPALKLLFPSVPMLRSFGNELEQHRILRVCRWDPGIMSQWSYNGKSAGTENGVFNECATNPEGWLEVSGWANLPGRAGPADYVLITVKGPDGVPHPWTMLPADLASPDVAAALSSDRMSDSAFRMILPPDGLPTGRIEITAWAVDAKHAAIRPLARTFALDH